MMVNVTPICHGGDDEKDEEHERTAMKREMKPSMDGWVINFWFYCPFGGCDNQVELEYDFESGN